MAQIIIRKLQVEAAVGLLDWEMNQTQVLELSCSLQVDISHAAESDSITYTVDYAELRETIQSFCRSHRFYLLEALVESLANHVLGKFLLVQSLRLTLIKPAIFADADGVGVEIEKKRSTVPGGKGQLL